MDADVQKCWSNIIFLYPLFYLPPYKKYEIDTKKRSYLKLNKSRRKKSTRKFRNKKPTVKKNINFAAWELSLKYEHVVQAIGRNRKIIAQKFKQKQQK